MLIDNSADAAYYSTRRKRRSAVKVITLHLSAIRDAEQRALDNLPDNFKNGGPFETGEIAVDAIDEAIDILADIY